MGRHPRIEGKALAYYVSSRGRNSQEIFRDDQDRIYFINLLKQQRIMSKLAFYAYILLPDLYACLMETHKNNFIQSMHRINSGYANYLNRRYHYKCKILASFLNQLRNLKNQRYLKLTLKTIYYHLRHLKPEAHHQFGNSNAP